MFFEEKFDDLTSFCFCFWPVRCVWTGLMASREPPEVLNGAKCVDHPLVLVPLLLHSALVGIRGVKPEQQRYVENEKGSRSPDVRE